VVLITDSVPPRLRQAASPLAASGESAVDNDDGLNLIVSHENKKKLEISDAKQ